MLLNIYYILGLVAALGLLVWLLVDDIRAFRRGRESLGVLRPEVWFILVITIIPFLNIIFWGWVGYTNWWDRLVEYFKRRFK